MSQYSHHASFSNLEGAWWFVDLGKTVSVRMVVIRNRYGYDLIFPDSDVHLLNINDGNWVRAGTYHISHFPPSRVHPGRGCREIWIFPNGFKHGGPYRRQ